MCKHYWLINSPEGEYSFGYCKYCGRLKRFINHIDYTMLDLIKTSNVIIQNENPVDMILDNKRSYHIARNWNY